jgi:kinesin family protein 3/17
LKSLGGASGLEEPVGRWCSEENPCTMQAAAKVVAVAAAVTKKDPETVKVVVRCRPMSKKEVEDSRKRIIEMVSDKGEVTVRNPEADPREPPKPFTFDHVYDWNSNQEIVFEETAQPIIDSVLTGYNGTVFAYGQTGTGKSHTMEGFFDPPEMRGIIPRAFCRIFEKIEATHDQNFLVRASFLEIYNEEVLLPRSKPL